MERWRDWLKQPYGQKLRRLHAWNAWTVLLLAISGVILYIPSFRELGRMRVLLKQAHIGLGILSVVLIALYVPLIGKHLRQLRGRRPQLWNLAIVSVVLLGWSLSGIVLWQFRHLPPAWSNTALIFHDLFTWVGVPYAIYHSVSRSRLLKREELKERQLQRVMRENAASVGATEGEPAFTQGRKGREFDPPLVSRRTFLRWGTITVLVLAVGPLFYRWLRSMNTSTDNAVDQLMEQDGNHMVPLPSPAPDSLKPLGGGATGSFRIYTVTDIPSFSSDTWQFSVGGLVEQPIKMNWEQFLKVPRKVQVSGFYCVTGWTVNNCTWEGIPLSQLLDQVKVKPEAKFVKFYSGDGVYTDALSLEQARMVDVMVAVLLDGKEIPQQLGGPVRLIVPQMYGYKSVKWLNGIELIDKEHIGFWEERGYDNDAWVGKSNLYF